MTLKPDMPAGLKMYVCSSEIRPGVGVYVVAESERLARLFYSYRRAEEEFFGRRESHGGELAKLDWQETWMTWFQRTQVRLMGPVPGYIAELPPGTRMADPFGICVAPDREAVQAWGFEVGGERTTQ